MAKQNVNDQLQRRQSRNAAAERVINQETVRKRQIRSWVILVGVIPLTRVISKFSGNTRVEATAP